MIARAEIERSLTGAWRLFLNKPDAMRFFDVSADGFWRSFQAIALVAPLYLITALDDRRVLAGGTPTDGATFNDAAFWAAQVLTLAIDWVALPILLAALADFLGVRRQYPAYIVARNWATVLMILPFAAISILHMIGVIDDELIVIPSLVALGFALRFGYLIARQALGVATDVAIGLVALDFLLSLAIVRLIGRLFGVGQ